MSDSDRLLIRAAAVAGVDNLYCCPRVNGMLTFTAFAGSDAIGAKNTG